MFFSTDEQIRLNPIVEFLTDDGNFDATEVRILDNGTTDTKESQVGNAAPAKIHSQAMMRYNTLFTQILTMTIPLNTNLTAGDILNCEFPRIDQQERKEPDEVQSGLYLVKKLTHFFESKGSYTKLQLVRDTNGRKAK